LTIPSWAGALRPRLRADIEQLLDALVCHLERLHDLRLGELQRAAFDHDDRFARAGDGESKSENSTAGRWGSDPRPSTRPTRTAAIGPFQGIWTSTAPQTPSTPSTRRRFSVGREHVHEDLTSFLSLSGRAADRAVIDARRVFSSPEAGLPAHKHNDSGLPRLSYLARYHTVRRNTGLFANLFRLPSSLSVGRSPLRRLATTHRHSV